jgi:hypothetical protein
VAQVAVGLIALHGDHDARGGEGSAARGLGRDADAFEPEAAGQ